MIGATARNQAPLPIRLWAYQRERFPLTKHGPFIAVFTASALSTASLAAPNQAAPSLGRALGAFVSVLAGFLLMRIADEFKDAATDARYRPHRAVPRGLVRLQELFGLGLAAATTQAALVLAFDVDLAPTLLLWWAFFLLTVLEFGAPRWLEKRPLLYMATHLPSLALLYLHASAWTAPARGLDIPAPLAWAVATAYGSGVVFEIARKLRAPCDEQQGVATYTAAWGPHRASYGLLFAMFATAACALRCLTLAVHAPGAAVAGCTLLTAALVFATLSVARFVRQPTAVRARALRRVGALFTLLVFLVMGPLALLGVLS